MSAAPGTDDLDAMLERLHLPTIRRLYVELALRAETEHVQQRLGSLSVGRAGRWVKRDPASVSFR